MKFLILLCILLIVPFAGASLSISSPVIRASISEGEVVDYDLTVLNQGKSQKLSISSKQTIPFFSLADSSASLNEGESYSIPLKFDSLKLSKGIYVGSIKIDGEFDSIIVPAILEVSSKQALFDISILENPSYSQLSPGVSFSPNINVYNLRSIESDATLEIALYDLDGSILTRSVQEVKVLNSVEISPSLDIPDSISYGQYVLAIKVIRGDSVGTASSVVRVSEEKIVLSPSNNSKTLFYIIFLVVFLLIAFLVINYYWTQRLKKNAVYWSKHMQEHESESPKTHKTPSFNNTKVRLQKLESQKELLQKAYDRRFIKKISYEQGIKNISKAISLLKKRL